MNESRTDTLRQRVSRSVLPIGILTDGRTALVVGGGQTATRKVRLLLEAALAVQVVSPELTEQLQELIATGQISHLPREFAESDVSGKAIVFAATDNRGVNRTILQTCRQSGVLCSCVDGNWADGDFVTPAITRHGNLTIAVSTGGRSCRQSRMIRDSLHRHIASVESADLLVMGTSHNYLTVDEREPFQLVGERLNRIGRMLKSVWGVHEFTLLNTCNRAEMLAVVSPDADIDEVIKCILGLDGLRNDQFYVKRGRDAFEHVAMMAAGLLSQTPGEFHIVAQIKEAMLRASETGWAGGIMHEWIAHALHVSKDIRRRTSGFLREFEIEDLCMEYLEGECEDMGHRRALVLGTGVVGRGITERLVQRDHDVLWCFHRNRPELSADWQGRVTLLSMNELRDRLAHADLIICATSATGHVLHTGHAPFFDQQADTLIVDLAMPRNVAPELNRVAANLRVVDLDDLKQSSHTDVVKAWEQSRASLDKHRELYERIIENS